ncbi:MAG: hypothetical protein JRG96_15890 [Deltaproteobacteria bacterium]|nr:hypothetical protein [Deltaproteobacteria bacterium]MBW2417898.1 hypothetical protein [Deltaproteobacteria bacterium]
MLPYTKVMAQLVRHDNHSSFGLDFGHQATVEPGPTCMLTSKWQVRIPDGGRAH